jgi:hypothetical protein
LSRRRVAEPTIDWWDALTLGKLKPIRASKGHRSPRCLSVSSFAIPGRCQTAPPSAPALPPLAAALGPPSGFPGVCLTLTQPVLRCLSAQWGRCCRSCLCRSRRLPAAPLSAVKVARGHRSPGRAVTSGSFDSLPFQPSADFLRALETLTEHCLRGRPVKPRRAGQQSTRFKSLIPSLGSIS